VTDVMTSTDTATSPSDAAATGDAATATAQTSASSTTTDATGASASDGTVLGGGAQEAGAASDATDDQAGDKADAPAGPPEKYELALEGVELDASLVSEAEPILRELNLTNDQANALLPLAPKIMAKAQEATMQQLVDAGAQQRKAWLDAFNADPDIGGAKREETTHLAAKGLDALGYGSDHPFRKALNESGFGNHPDMIRAFRRIGEMVGEDGSFVRSNDGVQVKVDAAKRLYPND